MKTVYRKWLSQKLRSLMNDQGISIRAMARRLGINLTKFRSYVEERSEPSNLTLKKICKELSTSMDAFMEDCPDEEGAKFLPTTSQH